MPIVPPPKQAEFSERAVEAHVADIFTKLALPPMGDDRRRMLAMLLSRS